MKLNELKETLDGLTSDLDSVENNSIYTIENNAMELTSHASEIEQEISDIRSTIYDVRSQLNGVVNELDNLEGFDVDKVRKEVAEEIVFKLANKLGKFIEESVLPSLPIDELKKAPAKKSTETDNQ